MSQNNQITKTIAKLMSEFGATLLPDTQTHRLRMEIQSELSGNIYVVSQRLMKNGGTQFECGCKGWIYHRKCKHLTAMVPALEKAADMLDAGQGRAPQVSAKAAPVKAAPRKPAAKKAVLALAPKSSAVSKLVKELQAKRSDLQAQIDELDEQIEALQKGA